MSSNIICSKVGKHINILKKTLSINISKEMLC